MEPSRDDFVIAIRSAFLKKETQQRFSLIVLIFFATLFIVLSSFNFKFINYTKIAIKEIVYRSSFIVSIPENYLKKTYFTIQSHFDLHEKYQKNKIELKKIKEKKNLETFIKSENIRLKKIIDEYLVASDEVVAKVLIDKQSPFLRSIIANKGSKDGIKLGMVVLDGQYLVGKIVEVNYSTSRILLLSDLNSKIPVIIEPKGIQSILSGSGEHHGVIQYLRIKYNIENDSIVYTSGAGGLFKAGIPIGKIKKKETISIDEKLNNDKEIIFFSDFSQLEFVKILEFKKEKLDE